MQSIAKAKRCSPSPDVSSPASSERFGKRSAGSAPNAVLNAVQQLSFALGVAGVGTLFFSLLDDHRLPANALTTTALLTLVPLAASFALAFRLPPKPLPDGRG